ncbi:MAG: hypothetical protein L3J34_00940 [Flavobacteriaceae bacterium]|nr:hypothetical protein [Flavobacteriaceae bacterium]
MFDTLKKHIENRVQLVKFELVGILSNLAVKMIGSLILLFISMFILIMLSISLSFWMSSLLGSYVVGFASVGAIYLFILIVYIVFFKKKIDTLVKNQIVSAVFVTEEELKDKDY